MSDAASSGLRPVRFLRRLSVVPVGGEWQVRREGSGRAVGVYPTQSEATAAASAALRKSGGAVQTLTPGGQTAETLTLGRQAMAKIAAVEGIALTAEMQDALKAFDRAGASNEERRREIARRFGGKG